MAFIYIFIPTALTQLCAKLTMVWKIKQEFCDSRKYPYPMQRVREILRGRGSERGKFPKGTGVHKAYMKFFFPEGLKCKVTKKNGKFYLLK